MPLENSADRWDAYYANGDDFFCLNWQSISRFMSYLTTHAPTTALDIGCGTGHLSRELSRRGYRVVGVDISLVAIERARALTTVPTESLTYLHHDIEKDPLHLLPHKPYGLITCKSVYTFILNKEAFLMTVNKLLDPEGTFVIISRTKESLPDERHHIATQQEDIALLEKYFKMEHFVYRSYDNFVLRRLPY